MTERRCSGCYQSFSGWWCDNCSTWPCECPADDAPITDQVRLGIEAASAALGRQE